MTSKLFPHFCCSITQLFSGYSGGVYLCKFQIIDFYLFFLVSHMISKLGFGHHFLLFNLGSCTFLVVRLPKIDFLWFFQIFQMIFSAAAIHLKSRFKILKTSILSFFSYLLLHNSKYMWAMYMKLSETMEGVNVSAYFKFQNSISYFLSATWSQS